MPRQRWRQLRLSIVGIAVLHLRLISLQCLWRRVRSSGKLCDLWAVGVRTYSEGLLQRRPGCGLGLVRERGLAGRARSRLADCRCRRVGEMGAMQRLRAKESARHTGRQLARRMHAAWPVRLKRRTRLRQRHPSLPPPRARRTHPPRDTAPQPVPVAERDARPQRRRRRRQRSVHRKVVALEQPHHRLHSLLQRGAAQAGHVTRTRQGRPTGEEINGTEIGRAHV